MKISCVAHAGNEIDFFNELAAALAQKISGLEVIQRFAPFIDDVPYLAKKCAEESDFVFVFAVAEDKKEFEITKRKLTDIELSTGTRILKAVVDESFSGLSEEETAEVKNALVEEYSSMISRILYNEESFRPTQVDEE
jgi:riboflavin synthase